MNTSQVVEVGEIIFGRCMFAYSSKLWQLSIGCIRCMVSVHRRTSLLLEYHRMSIHELSLISAVYFFADTQSFLRSHESFNSFSQFFAQYTVLVSYQIGRRLFWMVKLANVTYEKKTYWNVSLCLVSMIRVSSSEPLQLLLQSLFHCTMKKRLLAYMRAIAEVLSRSPCDI